MEANPVDNDTGAHDDRDYEKGDKRKKKKAKEESDKRRQG
jgi:hypothetical protein